MTNSDWMTMTNSDEYYVKEYVYDCGGDIVYKYNYCPTTQERFDDEYAELIYWLEIKRNDMGKTCDNCFDYIFKCSD
jgi:hypothetical protein